MQRGRSGSAARAPRAAGRPTRELRAQADAATTAWAASAMLISNDYYPALAAAERRPRHRRDRRGARPASIVTRDGIEHAVDTIVFGTGFHVIDMPIGERVRGVDGRTLAEVWRGSPRRPSTARPSPASRTSSCCSGPNTGLGHNSMVFMIESQIAYIAGRAARRWSERGVARRRGAPRGAGGASTRAVQERLRGHGLEHRRLRELVPRRPRAATRRIWPGSTWPYKRLTRRFDAESYDLRTPAARARARRAGRYFLTCEASITKASVSSA